MKLHLNNLITNNNNQNTNFKSKIYSEQEIQGTETKAKIYTSKCDSVTKEQIYNICSHPALKDVPVRIMPDTHAGKDAVVGFTAPVSNNGEIIPGLISGDIGCGMLCCEIDLNGQEIDFQKLDKIIQSRVANAHIREQLAQENDIKDIKKDLQEICNQKLNIGFNGALQVLGTVGKGNHFIELAKGENDKIYLVIHSGSRHIGQAIYNYHQNIAKQQHPYKIENLSYLSGDEAKSYIEDMKLAQKYAEINRRTIANEIISEMGWREISSFESVHNYISDDGIIRKGAISANSGQKVIIPLNMRDGSLIAVGKGNQDWNNSAPHGAGRKLSRAQAKKEISIDDYLKAMNGIYTTSICSRTKDEAPQAYKNADEITKNIEPTVEIVEKIKPVYNFKNKN